VLEAWNRTHCSRFVVTVVVTVVVLVVVLWRLLGPGSPAVRVA
jgi:hypothetical protein